MKMKKSSANRGNLKRRTRAQAIRAKCMDCCCDYSPEVRNCEIKNCPLWIYRMGYEMDFNGERITRTGAEE